MTIDNKDKIEVRVTDRAVFPLAIFTAKLLTFPLGQAATNTIPKATLVAGFTIRMNKIVRIGKMKSWVVKPTKTALGKRRIFLKSSGFISNATPKSKKPKQIFRICS